jgi:3'-phosphoadenosine 5'-phosphosulfate sulfotransferase (PAPS reductase)/FAD synthetase
MFKPIKNPVPRDAAIRANTAELLPLEEYDFFLVSFSGGKDSLACYLYLLELGIPPEKIQLWHQLIDGKLESGEPNFMDWEITEDYCRAVAEAMESKFKVDPLYFQWKDGGFKREMLRQNQKTAGVYFERQTPYSSTGNRFQHLKPSDRGKLGTRRMFPQKGPMTTRWCTSYMKIDVMSRAINNEHEFDYAKLCVVTGERREESNSPTTGRATYAEVDRHKCTSRDRTVHQWRPVIDWSEYSIWKIIERWKINPHPCYHLGFSRCSCMTCIYGRPQQWATVREIDPARFKQIADYEEEFGVTIDRKYSVHEMADRAEPYPEVFADKHQLAIGLDTVYPRKEIIVPGKWTLPAGAGRSTGGPT